MPVCIICLSVWTHVHLFPQCRAIRLRPIFLWQWTQQYKREYGLVQHLWGHSYRWVTHTQFNDNVNFIVRERQCSLNAFISSAEVWWWNAHYVQAQTDHCNTFWIVTYIQTYGKTAEWVVAHPTWSSTHRPCWTTQLLFLPLFCVMKTNTEMSYFPCLWETVYLSLSVICLSM